MMAAALGLKLSYFAPEGGEGGGERGSRVYEGSDGSVSLQRNFKAELLPGS